MSDKLRDELEVKIKTLVESCWNRRINWVQVESWLENFTGLTGDVDKERLHALYLLACFLYYDNPEIRELLRAVYRDHFQYPLLEAIRRHNGDTRDLDLIQKAFDAELSATRFVGVGNPSESGAHLLFYFRQENKLPKDLFIDTYAIFRRTEATSSPTRSRYSLRFPEVKRYVFLDDFCGSGIQVCERLKEVIEELQTVNSNLDIAFLTLFATSGALEHIRTELGTTIRCETVFELDDSYKTFSTDSRIFKVPPPEIDPHFAMELAETYGRKLCDAHPLGWRNCQLLLGFFHNVPDNTLPIIWYEESEGSPWRSVFKRYSKIEWVPS
ncbi:MAG: hypothetical protein IPG64_27590 [Haliea sp.]|nr:hypothetical protein [Haliea sp.]